MRVEARSDAALSAAQGAAGRVMVLFETGAAGAATIDVARAIADRDGACLTVVSVVPQAPSGSRCGNSAGVQHDRPRAGRRRAGSSASVARSGGRRRSVRAADRGRRSPDRDMERGRAIRPDPGARAPPPLPRGTTPRRPGSRARRAPRSASSARLPVGRLPQLPRRRRCSIRIPAPSAAPKNSAPM